MEEKKTHPAGSGFWQIILPTILGAVLLVSIGVWFIFYAGGSSVSRFAEISTVLLVIPVFFIALVIGLILAGLTFGVTRIMGWIPRLTGPVLEILDKIRRGAQALSKKTARVVIEPAAWRAGLRMKKDRADQQIELKD